MQDDHYVAQTYLRHFAGPNKMLRAYRKSNGETFPCTPSSICHERDGDIIPDFLREPGYLGRYRAEFEPLWNAGIAALQARAPNASVKFQIAGYWAQLLVCTPTWTRIAKKSSDHMLGHVASSLKPKSNKALAAAVEDFKLGKITIETEKDFVRAHNAASVLNFAWALYNADWKVYENDSDVPFLTSDNPAAFEDMGDTWAGPASVPFVRYLPLTPKLCLECDLTRHRERFTNVAADFSQPPQGIIRGGRVTLKGVEQINTYVVKCAEDLVLTSGESEYARTLTARYAGFRVVSQSMRVESPRGVYIANRTRCVEPEPATT